MIIIGAFAVFPEDGNAVETVYMTADEPSADQTSTIVGAGQQDGNAPKKPSPEQQIAENFERKNADIASTYMNKIQAVVAEDTSHKSASNSHNQTKEVVTQEMEQVSADTQHAALAAYEAVLSAHKKQAPSDDSQYLELLQVDAVIPEAPVEKFARLQKRYRAADKRLDHFSRLNLASVEDPAPVAPAPAAANPADAAAKAKEDAASAKADLAKKMADKKKKMKKKAAQKLKDLKKRKAEEVKKNKERKQKEVVGSITLKRTGMEHLKHVMRRGKSRVQRRFMKAQGKVYKQVTKSVNKMQNSSPGQAAIKAASAIRRKNKAAALSYEAWKQVKESHWKDQEEQGKEDDIRHAYQDNYKTMDTADMYKDAVARIHDDDAAGEVSDGPDIHDIPEVAAGDGDGDLDADAKAAPKRAPPPTAAAVATGDGDGAAPPTASADAAGDGDGAAKAALQAQFEAMMTKMTTTDKPADSAVEDAKNTDYIPATNALPSGAGSHRHQAMTVSGKATPKQQIKAATGLKAAMKAAQKMLDRKAQKKTQKQAEKQAKHQLGTEPVDKGVKLHVVMHRTRTEEDSKFKPNDFNPVNPSVTGEATKPTQEQVRLGWASGQKDDEAHKIKGEGEAKDVKIASHALIHELNDQDRKKTKDAANAKYDAQVKKTRERKVKKHAAKVAKWHEAELHASKRALPLVTKLSKKYAKKHWKQVWGAFENKANRPPAREREHLVHPEETRTGEYGAQGVPRHFAQPSTVAVKSNTFTEVGGDNDDAAKVDKKMLGAMEDRAHDAEKKEKKAEGKKGVSQHDVDAAQKTAEAASAAHDAERGAAAVAGEGADQAQEGSSQADAVKARMDKAASSDSDKAPAPPVEHFLSAGMFTTAEQQTDMPKKEPDFSKFATAMFDAKASDLEMVPKQKLDKELQKEQQIKDKYEAKLKKLQTQNDDYAQMYHEYKEDAQELGKLLKQNHIMFRPELMP
jgi:hypothetical protein